MSDTLQATRQPMCGGGKIQLPAINRRQGIAEATLNSEGNFDISEYRNDVTMNANITGNDLCYNRCPNGEAPQVDKKNGQYFCLVPALVTYQVKQNSRTPEIKNESDGTRTTVQKVDEINYTKSYTVSCQSTDLLDYSPQTGNKENNIMYGIPIQIKSGFYESPMSPGTLRNVNFSPDGESKWFCKRPMYGAPPLGALQSPYEAITPQMVMASTEISDDCLSHINNNGVYSTEKNVKCEPRSAITNAAIAITGGVPLVSNNVDDSSVIATPLTVVQSSDSTGVTVPNTTTSTNPNTGVVTTIGGTSASAFPGGQISRDSDGSVGIFGVSAKPTYAQTAI
jgi:hypothetical protein